MKGNENTCSKQVSQSLIEKPNTLYTLIMFISVYTGFNRYITLELLTIT